MKKKEQTILIKIGEIKMSKLLDKKVSDIIKEIDVNITFRELIQQMEDTLRIPRTNLDNLEDYEVEYYFNMLISLMNLEED